MRDLGLTKLELHVTHVGNSRGSIHPGCGSCGHGDTRCGIGRPSDDFAKIYYGSFSVKLRLLIEVYYPFEPYDNFQGPHSGLVLSSRRLYV